MHPLLGRREQGRGYDAFHGNRKQYREDTEIPQWKKGDDTKPAHRETDKTKQKERTENSMRTENENNVRTVLIAEDDADIVQVLRLYLKNEGYNVLDASDGESALSIVRTHKVDIGIFDILMPKMNGYELVQKVREFCNMPIIILSARKEYSDKILGLDLGADDYLTKPFNPLEVVARVRSALRRFYHLNNAAETPESDELIYEPFRLKLSERAFYRDDVEIPITPSELKILTLMMRNPGRVFTKIQIYEHLNGEYFDHDENTITVHMSNLRSKLERDSRNPEYIITVRGIGYKFGEGKRA